LAPHPFLQGMAKIESAVNEASADPPPYTHTEGRSKTPETDHDKTPKKKKKNPKKKPKKKKKKTRRETNKKKNQN